MQSRKSYPTDLNDTEWQLLAPLIPAAKPGGRSEEYPKREIVNAILYALRTGCAWRFVPNDLPPWGIVYHSFWCWRTEGTWKRIHDILRGDLRVLEGRRRQPIAGFSTRSRSKRRIAVVTTDVTAPRRSTGVSGLSSWSPWACCWQWW